MEGYSRDLLRGIGGVDGGGREERPRVDLETEEEVELSLGLSLGGRFGRDRKGEKLVRSSSVAAVLVLEPEEAAVLAPPALARTSSLPVKAEPEAVTEEMLHFLGGGRRGSGGDEVAELPAASLPASGSPSSGSSDGEGRRLEVNIADTLMRTSSLPAGIEDEWRKRKEAQSLKRLEIKRKRIERRNSFASNDSKEVLGQILEEVNAKAEKVESSNVVAMENKQLGHLNNSNDKHHLHGLPPTHRPKFTSQHNNLSGMPKMLNSVAEALSGTHNAEEHNPSPTVSPPIEGTNGIVTATPPSALAVMAAALHSRGEQHHVTGRLAGRAKSTGDVERNILQEMPCVRTNGLPNGRRVEGFLYKYRKGEEVRIVCICHGSFLTPAEFVKHAGGGDVANPLRHIVVNPIPPSIF